MTHAVISPLKPEEKKKLKQKKIKIREAVEKLEINRRERRWRQLMRSPAPARGARRAQMLLWPAAIPPAGHEEHTRDGTARHSPGTTGRDPRGTSREPSPGRWSSQHRGQDPRQP